MQINRVQANSIEHNIAAMLLLSSSDSLMPVIDVFQSKENLKEAFVVTPFLRTANSPAFDSVKDILDCGEQLLEVSDKHPGARVYLRSAEPATCCAELSRPPFQGDRPPLYRSR